MVKSLDISVTAATSAENLNTSSDDLKKEAMENNSESYESNTKLQQSILYNGEEKQILRHSLKREQFTTTEFLQEETLLMNLHQ